MNNEEIRDVHDMYSDQILVHVNDFKKIDYLKFSLESSFHRSHDNSLEFFNKINALISKWLLITRTKPLIRKGNQYAMAITFICSVCRLASASILKCLFRKAWKWEQSFEATQGSLIPLKMAKCVQTPGLHYSYFNNYFTSYDLFCYLKDQGFKAIGTVRENRLRQESKTLKDISQEPQRTYDYANDENGKTVKCLGGFKLWFCETSSKLSETCEKIKNKGSCSSATNDKELHTWEGRRHLAQFHIPLYIPNSSVLKKWYWRLVNNFLSLSVVNSRIFYWKVNCKPPSEFPILLFLRVISINLIKTFQYSRLSSEVLRKISECDSFYLKKTPAFDKTIPKKMPSVQ